MFLSKLGYSELVQRIFEKITFFRVDPLARAPHTTFLQLGMARAHRSVLEANKLARMTKEERLLATTTMTSGPFVDDVTHRVD